MGDRLVTEHSSVCGAINAFKNYIVADYTETDEVGPIENRAW